MTRKIAVIGSGLGGLTSAVILARAGFSVTVFERQPIPGGYAIQFKRKGFTFDPSLHSVPAGDAGDTFFNLIKEIGIGDQISFIRLKNGPGVFLGDREFLLPNNPEQIYEYLGNSFPKEKNSIERFSAYIESYAKVYSGILLDKGPLYKTLPPFLVKLPAFLHQSYESTDHFLSNFFKDPVLRSLLFQYAIFMGIPMDEFPAVNFILMTSMLLSKGMYSIAGGGGMLTDVLVKRLLQFDGKILTNIEIVELKIENGKAIGVKDKMGNEYLADVVIANTNVIELVKMTPGKSVPRSYKKVLSQLKPSISVVQLHIGLDCHVFDVGIKQHLYLCFPESNIDRCIKYQRDALNPVGFSVTAPGISDPDTIPGNTRVLSVVGGVSGEKWLALDENSYKYAKEECCRLILDKLCEMFPLLKAHVVVTDLATPRTFHQYTGNPLGALMGFNCSCGTHQSLLKIGKFPIENVFLGGAWTDKLGGFMMSMKAGQKAAEGVVRLMKKRGIRKLDF
jgi:phytoene dehydrogenase-like protein